MAGHSHSANIAHRKGLVDAKRVIQQLVGVGGAGVLSDEQQDAPVGRFEDRQQAPRALEIQPANCRKLFSSQAHAGSCASASAYVVNS